MNLKMRVGFICGVGPVIALVALLVNLVIVWFSENTISIPKEDWLHLYSVALPTAFIFLMVGGAFLYLDGSVDSEGEL